LETIAHLKHRQVHRDQDQAHNKPQENNDQRFHHAADRGGFLFHFLDILFRYSGKEIIELVGFFSDFQQLDHFGRVYFELLQALVKRFSLQY
jgi:hypothetical protein